MEQPTPEAVEAAHKGWMQELMDDVQERAKFSGELPIPDLDDMVFTPQFLESDLALALQYISTTMNMIRKSPGWKSCDLKVYKAWRQKLLIHRNKVKNITGLSEGEIKAIQAVLQEFYNELQRKPE